MTVQCYAQPYDIDAQGFYFSTYDDYSAGAAACLNRWGQPVEEFEIQLIDADGEDIALFEALGVHQANLKAFLQIVQEWDDHTKIRVAIAVGECGYRFDPATDDPDAFDVDLYEVDSLKDLAEQFVDEGLFGDIPEHIRPYLDYALIARDLAMDYGEITIAGTHYAYRCG